MLDDINTCGLLIDAVDEITGAMFAAEIYEQRYHKAETESDKSSKSDVLALGTKVLEKIVPLYADILFFSYYSKKYLQPEKLVCSPLQIFIADSRCTRIATYPRSENS